MGFFDKWFRRDRPSSKSSLESSSESLPEPEPKGQSQDINRESLADGHKVVSDLSDDSPWVLVDTGNGAVTMMDRDTYDYRYGDSDAPDPAQHDLDELLPTVNRARVLSTGILRGTPLGSEVLVDTNEPDALAALRSSLQVVEDPQTFCHCACLGGPTLELFSDDELVATIGLQHGHAIRWSRWKHDARLEEGQQLTDWLTDNGVSPKLLEVIFHNQYQLTGLLRGGTAPLTETEQELRLVETSRRHEAEEALQACNAILEKDPDVAYGYAVRAMIEHQCRDFEAMIDDSTRAIEMGFRSAELYFSRAVGYDTLGEEAKALDDCTTALEIDPEHVNSLNSRGLIESRLGMHVEAERDLGAAIQLAPKWSLPYLNRAQSRLVRGEHEEAIADCDQILALGEQYGDIEEQVLAYAYWYRGHARRLMKDEQQAEGDFSEALRLNPRLRELLSG